MHGLVLKETIKSQVCSTAHAEVAEGLQGGSMMVIVMVG